LLKVSSEHQCPKSSYSINPQADMKAANIVQIAILALPTAVGTFTLYISVPNDLKDDITVIGNKFPKDGKPGLTGFEAMLNDACIDNAWFLTTQPKDTKCNNTINHTFISRIERITIDPQPLNISMSGCDLSVSYKILYDLAKFVLTLSVPTCSQANEGG
jgi:hypothetical protein